MNYTEEITNCYARLEKTIEALNKEAINQVMNLLQEAYKNESKIVGMTGYNGGKLYQMSDYNMHAPINDMQIAEDIHLTFNHMMMSIFHKMVANEK